MKIDNVKLGFATNSSSSHSIVIVPKEEEDKFKQQASWDIDHYGWEYFVLRKENNKIHYLISMIYQQLKNDLGKEIADIVIQEWLDFNPLTEDIGGVDHNSHFCLPKSAFSKKVCGEFIRDLNKFIRRKDVAVLGGNDNGGVPTGEYDFRSENEIPLGRMWNSGWLAKKSGDWWTTHQGGSGGTLRFSFEKEPKPFTRSVTPDLVDLKITNKCNMKCKYCYQDSTKDGEHAQYGDIRNYLETLSKVGVFEVAIGGGEPTLHPELPKILSCAREVGVIPNLTTRVSPGKWQPELVTAVREYCGAWALSVETPKDVLEIVASSSMLKLHKGVAQYVMGTASQDEFENIITLCKDNYIQLTVLGFKNVGRGKDYTDLYMNNPMPLFEIKPQLAVDTAFVQRYSDTLEEHNISNLLTVEQEGISSMYIDAVQKKAAASSWQLEKTYDLEPYYWRDDYWESNLFGIWNMIEPTD